MTEVKKDSANFRLTGNDRPYHPTIFHILMDRGHLSRNGLSDFIPGSMAASRKEALGTYQKLSC